MRFGRSGGSNANRQKKYVLLCFESTSADFTYRMMMMMMQKKHTPYVTYICAHAVADHTFETGSGCPRLLS